MEIIDELLIDDPGKHFLKLRGLSRIERALLPITLKQRGLKLVEIVREERNKDDKDFFGNKDKYDYYDKKVLKREEDI